MCSYFLSQWNLSNPVYYFCQSSEYTERWCYSTNLIVHMYLYSLSTHIRVIRTCTCTHVRVICTCTCTHCVLTYGLYAHVPVLTVYSRTGYSHMYLYSLCTHVRVIRLWKHTHIIYINLTWFVIWYKLLWHEFRKRSKASFSIFTEHVLIKMAVSVIYIFYHMTFKCSQTLHIFLWDSRIL